MTELETIARAKMYIDKLANGVNPLDDSIVPEQDVINNVRISRCFFFVSDILQHVIENGGIGSQKKAAQKEKKLPFSLSMEQRNAFPFTDDPTTVSVFTRRVNDLIDTEKMTPLKYSSITNWLVSIDMLALSSSDSLKNTKTPTPEGMRLGIYSEDRIGKNGPYTCILYNTSAQHFIMDNLDAIMEFEKDSTEFQGQPWTPQQDQCLLDLHHKGVPTEEIAITLKRNNSSIRSRLKKLGVTERKDI